MFGQLPDSTFCFLNWILKCASTAIYPHAASLCQLSSKFKIPPNSLPSQTIKQQKLSPNFLPVSSFKTRLMDFPFFQDPWDASSYPRYEKSLRGIPLQVKPKASPPQPLKSKMVSIPVHFIGSERGRSDSAIKIQKVFRGFLVRKNVEKIMAIRVQVNDIERSVSKPETVDLIRNDSKERLKVNEMLMSLLLKLDSITGVDSCVRDFRKSVIKKAIALQELVDAIFSGDQSIDSINAEAVDKSQGLTDSIANNCNQTLEWEIHDEITKDAQCVPNLSESEVILQNQGSVVVASKGEGDEESMETSRSESQTDSFGNHENVAVEEEADNKKEGVNRNSDSSKEECGENKRSKELIERMMEDNGKMMGLMEMLFERNEKQSRLLSALSQRVEQLEKAFLCDKLRRKKKRGAAAAVGSVDVKKCGKK